MSPESLPVKLRQARRSMSLAEAAERSGIPEHRIRMYEEGERQPYGKTLKRLAEAYGIPVQEFIGNGGIAAGGRRMRSPAPQTRRRRRRPRAPLAPVGSTLEIPVEVEAGQAVRLVIELVIRPQSAGLMASGTTTDSAVPVGSRAEPARERDTERPRPEVPSRKDPRPARVPGFVPAGTANMPRPPAPSASAEPSRSTPAHRDPLMEFRRAYREFRRDKK